MNRHLALWLLALLAVPAHTRAAARPNVVIIGTGEGQEQLRTVASPINLRNHITGIS
jgi:hypothetical protein